MPQNELKKGKIRTTIYSKKLIVWGLGEWINRMVL